MRTSPSTNIPSKQIFAGKTTITYPDSDGKPMADNTKQFDWIVTIKCGLELLFETDAKVFVAGDLLWYPVEGNNKIRAAPDALVAFGRPKGYRGSYKQWEEGGIAPQVVFEVLSPGNTKKEMAAKWQFYNQYGVEEYYLYDPDHGTLAGWQREPGELTPIEPILGWISPRLGISFDLDGEDLLLHYPNGKPFATYLQLHQQTKLALQDAKLATKQANLATKQAKLATKQAKQEAKKRAEQAKMATAQAKREAKKRAEMEKQLVQEAQRTELEANRAQQALQRAEQEAEARRMAEAEIARLKALLAAKNGKKV
jgi:Uma2 family endonuclease